jgi:transducin (beta)-like 1
MASVQIQPNLVPPAALVTFVQKGLQYMEAEANLDPVSTVGM